jgi:hypothetical protein
MLEECEKKEKTEKNEHHPPSAYYPPARKLTGDQSPTLSTPAKGRGTSTYERRLRAGIREDIRGLRWPPSVEPALHPGMGASIMSGRGRVQHGGNFFWVWCLSIIGAVAAGSPAATFIRSKGWWGKGEKGAWINRKSNV